MFILLSVSWACNRNCEDCNPKIGPMLSRIRADMIWTKTQTPSRKITPASVGYSMNLLRLRQHIYLIRNDSITDRLKAETEDDDWKQHRTFLHYPNGYGQVIKFVYEGNDNRRDLLEIITSPVYKGEYNATADTVEIHYIPGGLVDKKYWADEDKLL